MGAKSSGSGRRASAKTDLVKLDQDGSEIRDIRGSEIAMIFQEPMSSFSMVHTVGQQIMEAVQLHQEVSQAEAREIAVEMLSNVGIPDPLSRVDEYPFRLSGGMLQRAMIAMALSCNPNLLIADEPTTALDVTIQAQILDLMNRSQEQRGMAIMIITHDLSVVAEMADTVVVMYWGRVVEQASVRTIFPRAEASLYSRAAAVATEVGRCQKGDGSIRSRVLCQTRLPVCRAAPTIRAARRPSRACAMKEIRRR